MRSSQSSIRPPFRSDIEGLRGWLALAIVVYHLVSWPVGGVIGVDIFFVISGYLITSQLVRELETTGRISLSAFYVRRARRILPVTFVVLIVTVAASPLVWFAPRVVRTGLDAFAALTFVENWHLIAIGHSYLAAGDAVSPLQHFWSLAVEEQFYVAWPLLIIAVTGVVGARVGILRPLLVVTAVCSVGFAVYSAWRTSTALDSAYFDTFARAWEFGPGIAMGLLAGRAAEVGPRLRTTLTLVGFVGVLTAAFVVDPHVAFPWPGALPAVVGTALIVGFGRPGEGLVGRFLVARLATWVGRRSFSVYLWHFPLAIVVPALLGRSPLVLVGTFVLTFAVSAASFHFVERPARQSQWLAWLAAPRGARPQDARRHRRKEVTTVAVIGVVIVAMSLTQMRAPALAADSTFVAERLGLAHPAHADGAPLSADELRRGIAAGLAATRWPRDLTPALDDAYATVLPPEFDPDTGCRNDVTRDSVPRICRHGPPGAVGSAPSAVLIGDSTAAAWTAGVEAALLARGYRVAAETWSGCSPIAARSGAGGGSDSCAPARAAMGSLVETEHPDLVIAAGGLAPFEAESARTSAGAAFHAWAAGTRDAVDRLSRSAARVVLLGSPPPRVAPVDCASRLSSPASCATTVTGAYRAEQRAESSAVAAARAAGIDVSAIDVLPWFCAADGRCPAFVGTTLVTMDRTHLTGAMSLGLARVLGEALVPAG